MITKGIEGIQLDTHNWGKSVAFWESLGYKLAFETDHHSGQLENELGPWIFLAEVPESTPIEPLGFTVYLHVPQTTGDGWEATHWDTEIKPITDPDGRQFTLQAPAHRG